MWISNLKAVFYKDIDMTPYSNLCIGDNASDGIYSHLHTIQEAQGQHFAALKPAFQNQSSC